MLIINNFKLNKYYKSVCFNYRRKEEKSAVIEV